MNILITTNLVCFLKLVSLFSSDQKKKKMKQINFTFSFKKSLKNSNYRLMLSSLYEEDYLYNFEKFFNSSKILQEFFFSNNVFNRFKRETCNCVLKDMLRLVCMWRQIRGYPQGGNTTHTNSNNSKKNKLLLNFRINQFYKMFGQKKRNIFPTLVKAEYNNRLWYYNWEKEWSQASLFALRMLIAGPKAGGFNPAILATNQTNGYIRVGKASKIGKAKKLVKVFTIGVPLLFTRYIYSNKPPKGFPKLILKDDVNKKLGKKLRQRKNIDS